MQGAENRLTTKYHEANFYKFSYYLFCLKWPFVFADEGMWTFDNPPLRQWKERYNFEPSQEWLDKVRLGVGTVERRRLGEFCFAERADHHQSARRFRTARQDVQRRKEITSRMVFTPNAGGRSEGTTEIEANVLMSYEDVTSRVQAAVKAGSTDKQAASAKGRIGGHRKRFVRRRRA